MKRDKQGRFLKMKREPESEERAFRVERLNSEDPSPIVFRKHSTDLSRKSVIKLEPANSDDSDYQPSKHVKTALLAQKSQPEKKSFQAQLSSYFSPIKQEPGKDSLSQLSVFMAPVTEGYLGVKTPVEDLRRDVAMDSMVSKGNTADLSHTAVDPDVRRNAKTARKCSGSTSGSKHRKGEGPREQNSTIERNTASLFPSLNHQKGNLAYDRPVKIIGVREREGIVEYAVMFTPSFGKCLDAAIIPHHELISRAPWLFASFILSDIHH